MLHDLLMGLMGVSLGLSLAVTLNLLFLPR